MGRRKPKRLKTGDEPEEEVVIVKVRVKVKSDDDQEEESLDDDANEDEEEEEQAAQPVVEQEEEEPPAKPVAQIEWPAYVVLRPDYILMDYDDSMREVVIPNNKVIRPVNCWCYTNLDPVHWRQNSIDGCLTYGVCQVCCGSGPTGRCCVKCEVDNMVYICMLIALKDNKGEEITRLIDTQWNLDTQANRVQMTPTVDPWGYATMGLV
jgi:hypothetical protein